MDIDHDLKLDLVLIGKPMIHERFLVILELSVKVFFNDFGPWHDRTPSSAAEGSANSYTINALLPSQRKNCKSRENARFGLHNV